MRARLAEIVGSRQWEYAITTLIVINAVTLGMETSDRLVAMWGPILYGIDSVVLAIFVIEIAARLYVHRLRFFTDPWSVFDFTIVSIALVPASGEASVLRALRILRVLRLITVVPSLRRVVSGLIAAIPGMGSIVLLMAILFYVFSVMATELFGETFPEWFGTLGASAYSLFQIMTLESWSMGIVRPVMDVHPWAWVFFVPFILMTAFTVLNLFIGVIVSAMQAEVEQTVADDRDRMHDEHAAVMGELRALRDEIAALRATVGREAAE